MPRTFESPRASLSGKPEWAVQDSNAPAIESFLAHVGAPMGARCVPEWSRLTVLSCSRRWGQTGPRLSITYLAWRLHSPVAPQARFCNASERATPGFEGSLQVCTAKGTALPAAVHVVVSVLPGPLSPRPALRLTEAHRTQGRAFRRLVESYESARVRYQNRRKSRLLLARPWC